MEDDKLGRPIILLLSHMQQIKKWLIKNWLVAAVAVLLVVAGWQYWQIKKQVVIQASPYQGCAIKDPTQKQCEKDCGWVWENGGCCPPDRSACSKPGEYKCTNKPQKFECTYYSRFCRNPNYWRIVQTYSSVEEMCEDKDCKCEEPKRSPRPSPRVSPSPSPSPAAETGKLRIRKFNDRDKDGVKDWNEVSTGRAWPFQYRIGSGPWIDYRTNSFTGVGTAVTVPANSQVRVKELTIDGWTNSTPLFKTETVQAGEVQWFEFGNYRVTGPNPSPSPSPSPSVSPSPSPSPIPSPSPDTAGFVVRKFKDNDKDGEWDSNETSTGHDWQFQYRFNDGGWSDYTAWGGSGWGGIVSVGIGTKVEVKEIEQDGWTNTTGLILIKILEENKVYYFDFGNFANPNVVEASPPAVVPEAGSGFQIQPWLIVAGIGAVLQIAALLL